MFADLRTVWALVLRPTRGWMVLAVIGALAMALLDMAGVAAMLPLMQAVTGTVPDSGPLLWISQWIGSREPLDLTVAAAGVVALAFVLKSVATIAFRWWLFGRTTRVEADAASELLRRYSAAPLLGHRSRDLAGVNRTLMTSVFQTFGQVMLGLLSIASEAVTLLAIGIVLVVVSPVAALCGAVFFAVLAWGMQRTLRRAQRRVGRDTAEADLETWRSLMPLMNGFREIRLAGVAGRFLDRFTSSRLRRADAQRRMSLLSELPKYVLEIGIVVAIAAVAGLLFSTTDPERAIAVLGVFAAGCTRMLPSLNRLMASVATVRVGRVGLRHLAAEMDVLTSAPEHQDVPPTRTFSGDIEVRDLEFRFPDGDAPVLRAVDLAIVEGTTTAIVGPSGSGKSTLLDIVLGLIPPSAGEVSCGGDLITDDLSGWRAGLGVVPQDVFLVDDTLEANICFDGGAVDPERRDHAIHLAQLDELLSELPNGLQTRMGERGVRLSGGQRQRVGIARALYRAPSVLVLDEATSALDNVTEQRITQTISALRGRMTIIVVAHRLSTVRHADRVIFLSEGTVKASGTFAEVEATNAEFAHLVALGKL